MPGLTLVVAHLAVRELARRCLSGGVSAQSPEGRICHPLTKLLEHPKSDSVTKNMEACGVIG